MTEANRGRVTAGALLIVLGIAFLARQFLGGIGDEYWLLVGGALFVAGYFYWRAYGLLIPGCILIGLALGSIGQETLFDFGDFEAVGLGLGFVAIFAIDSLYQGRSHWWPLIPGGVLIVIGLAEGFPALEDVVSRGWPVILILIGLVVLAGAFRTKGDQKSRGTEEVVTDEEKS